MNRTLAFTVSMLISAAPCLAQSTTDADLAKQAQNPIANLISLPIQNNTNFSIGPYDRNQNVLNLQPVIPVSLGAVNLITRTIAPVVYQPTVNESSGGVFGVGDINATFFFSPAAAGKVTWGVGPIVVLPTSTDDTLGAGRWSLGPSAVALTMPGRWVIGAVVSNVWSVGSGDEGDVDVNSFLLQYFVNYNFPSKWYLTSGPIITANWEAASGDQWLVPFGGGFGKIFSIGSQPVNGQVQAFWNAVHPETQPYASWTLRMQLQLLFPK